MDCCSTSPPRPCARSPPIQASGCADRHDPGAAHLGLGADSSSACARHRARRRPRPRCRPLGALQTGVLPLRCGCSRACSGAASSKNCRSRIATGNCSSSASTCDLADAEAFADWLMPLRKCEWVVYAKRPFAGPEAVLAYLSRYTHRVAISNSRLVALDDRGVTFRWKDYRAKGSTRYKTMTLATEEFMRRFLLHVLPSGFHRIRHYGLLANANRKHNIATARELLHQPAPMLAADPRDVHTGSSAAPAHVRMPTLRCPNAHHRDLRTRPAHPRAAELGMRRPPSTRKLHRRQSI